MKKFTFSILFLTLLLTAAFVSLDDAPPQNKTLTNGAKLEWTPCWFDIPSLKTAYCGKFHPAEGQATGLQMPVVLIKSRNLFLRNSSPIMYLAGGPGYATGLEAQDMEYWWEWVAEQKWHHDLVLFDQRGTGRSEPSLKCPELTALIRDSLSKSVNQMEFLPRPNRWSSSVITNCATPALSYPITPPLPTAAMFETLWNLSARPKNGISTAFPMALAWL